MNTHLGRKGACRHAHRAHRIVRRLGKPCLTGDTCPAAYLLSDDSVAVIGTLLSEEARKKHHIPEPRPDQAIVIVPGELIRDAKKDLSEA